MYLINIYVKQPRSHSSEVPNDGEEFLLTEWRQKLERIVAQTYVLRMSALRIEIGEESVDINTLVCRCHKIDDISLMVNKC